jgi:LDH2 family malate/lactate/ureidoglycolate dehydrogenase
MQQRLRRAPKAEGQERIYIHGEKEYEETERRKRDGIPLNPAVVADLNGVAESVGIDFKI